MGVLFEYTGIWARLYWQPCWTILGTTKYLYIGNNGKPRIESINIIIYINKYYTKFWSIVDQFFKIVESIWSAFWAEYIPKVAYFAGHSIHVPIRPFHLPVCPFHVPICMFHEVSTVCPRSTYFWKKKNLEKKNGVIISTDFYQDWH